MSNYNSTNCNEVKKEIMVTACAGKSQLCREKSTSTVFMEIKAASFGFKTIPKSCDLDPLPTKLSYEKPCCSPHYIQQHHQHFTGFEVWWYTPDFKTSIIKSLLKTKTPLTLKMHWKTSEQSQTFHFCLKSLKRSLYTNSLHTSKKTFAIPSCQPTALDTVTRPPFYAL